MDADGFTLVMDDQFANAYRISYLALGGDDLTDVYMESGSTPTSAGNYDITGVGFQPDALLIAATHIQAAGDAKDTVNFSLGWATSASNQGVIFGHALDNQATSSTASYGYNGEILATYSASGSPSIRESFVSFGADGFTLNHLEGVGRTYCYICLKGGSYAAGDLTTRTDGNDITESVGFQPVAVLFGSAGGALCAQDTPANNLKLSIGAATSASNRACAAVWDQDALADTETARANYDSAVYANVQDDAVVGLMDLKSVSSTGFTCVMDDADPSACWVNYLAIGAAPVSSPSPSLSPSASASPTPSSSESSSASPSAAVIEVGPAATNRASVTVAGNTVLDLANPATGSGVITNIDIYVASQITSAKVGLYYLVSGTTYRCRSSYTTGVLAAGLNQLTGLSLEVQAGDFIGIYHATGTVDRADSGGSSA